MAFQKYNALLNALGRGILSNSVERNLEKFICRLYSGDTQISDAHFKMFLKGTKEREKLPPTQSSVRQHTKRANHQSTVWYLSLIAQPDIGNGYSHEDYLGNIVPHLLSEDAIPSIYLEITQGQCKRCNTAKCKCFDQKLRCTAGCGCSDSICQTRLNADDLSD